MVQLEEVEDEDLKQVFSKEFVDDDDFTDTDSEISDADDLVVYSSETFSERLLALRDMIPPSARRRITSTVSTVTEYAKSGLWLGGKTMWVVSTSALLLGVPYALSIADEQQMVEMEKEQKMREMGSELLTPGQGQQQQGKPAL
ncbi:mitochondrial import receptor protein [Varicellaria rhodocarpa]|nr:mitochondrial import receptor protein [Varicellaria rhodocarpa]